MSRPWSLGRIATGTHYWKNHSKRVIPSSRVSTRKMKLTCRLCIIETDDGPTVLLIQGEPRESWRPGRKGTESWTVSGIAGGLSKEYFPNVVGTYSSRTDKHLSGVVLWALFLPDLNCACPVRRNWCQAEVLPFARGWVTPTGQMPSSMAISEVFLNLLISSMWLALNLKVEIYDISQNCFSIWS